MLGYIISQSVLALIRRLYLCFYNYNHYMICWDGSVYRDDLEYYATGSAVHSSVGNLRLVKMAALLYCMPARGGIGLQLIAQTGLPG